METRQNEYLELVDEEEEEKEENIGKKKRDMRGRMKRRMAHHFVHMPKEFL